MQSLKNMCAHALEEPNITEEMEKEVMSTLFKVEEKIGDIKKATAQSQRSPFESQAKPPSGPVWQADFSNPSETLQSVDTGGFDPNSSPILQRLHKKKGGEKSQTKNRASPIDLDMQSFPTNGETTGESRSEEKSETQYKKALLELPQLSITIPLGFLDNAAEINRVLFESVPYQQVIPPGFFDAIEEDKHCIIEQPTPGIFVLKDPNNNQKTYFKDQFVDQDGLPIKDGDEFILPVLVEGNQSSLQVIFREK